MNGLYETAAFMARYDGRCKIDKHLEGNREFYTIERPNYMIFYNFATDTVSVDLWRGGGQDKYPEPLDNIVLITDKVLTAAMINDIIIKYINGSKGAEISNYLYGKYYKRPKKEHALRIKF